MAADILTNGTRILKENEMGLDMYLRGKKRVNGVVVEGEEVTQVEIEVGYWRKDWDLHELIGDVIGVEIENCKDYGICEDELVDLIDLIRGGAITEYDEEAKERTTAQLNRALELARKGWSIEYHGWW